MTSKVVVLALAAALLASGERPTLAASVASQPGLAKQLLQGCLQPPTQASVANLAEVVGAKPYSAVRNRRAMIKQEPTVIEDPPGSGEVQRTETTVTAFHGWDLPGSGAGSLEYSERTTRIDRIMKATGELSEATRVSRDRACTLVAPVASGRAMFELYETLHDEPYGLLISANRRRITVFRFDPDRYDIELSIMLDAPLAGVPPASGDEVMGRLVLSDGGPRFIDDVTPGVPIVRLTRPALLAALNRPASMELGNSIMEPVVQRLAALAARQRP